MFSDARHLLDLNNSDIWNLILAMDIGGMLLFLSACSEKIYSLWPGVNYATYFKNDIMLLLW